jgi:uncharacterized membrane-anchored protein YjiN (DUF445 family)
MKNDYEIVRQLDQAEDDYKRSRLRTMQRIAVGMLVLAAVVFAVARSLHGQHPAWGYVEAFAEAAMVGAMADWFAVVALFRHPLGIPVWHTAIIPNSKDAIGSNLGSFVENHFITEEGISAQIRQADLARRVGEWLHQKDNAGQVSKSVSSVLVHALKKVDDERMRALIREFAGSELAKLDLSRLAGGYLQTLIDNDAPQELLNNILEKLHTWLSDESNHESIGEFILRCFAIENAMIKSVVLGYAPKAIDSLREQVVAVRMNREHPLRQRIGDWIADSALRLQADPQWKETIERYQEKALLSDELQAAFGGIWDTIRARIESDLHRDQSAIAGAVRGLVQEAGRVLSEDAAVRDWLNATLEAASASLVRKYRGAAGKFIEQQLARWTKDEMSTRIELAIGRDLQFIRINGTLVGGLVGLLIYTITTAL